MRAPPKAAASHFHHGTEPRVRDFSTYAQVSTEMVGSDASKRSHPLNVSCVIHWSIPKRSWPFNSTRRQTTNRLQASISATIITQKMLPGVNTNRFSKRDFPENHTAKGGRA